MNVLLCPDSFKDALSAQDAATAMARGVQRAAPEAHVQVCPLADGGEGSLDALIAATGAERRQLNVQDALGRPRQAAWGWLSDQRTAFIELAEASGLQHLAADERNALHTSTFGVGELLLAALDQGAEKALLLLGGSATNDGGAGMLQALGARFLDQSGEPLPPGGAALNQLASLELDGLDPRLAKFSLEAAVDVDNPLLGERGASAVFGPQKGASPEEVEQLDRALGHFADISAHALSDDYRMLPGVGAAGGMGFAAKAFLNATLKPGIEMIIQQAGMASLLARADLVITGEGRLDGQSLSGKTPIGVSRAAKRLHKPVIVLAGSLGDGWQACFDEGVTAAFALADGPMTLADALPRTAKLLEARCESLLRLWVHRP
ncbi:MULTISPECIES: glycerate kinase [Halomonadaceae]|jgi:glycerate 2-kinase|uniref:glycerate kinase n=1 Tax=Halomonadaceae TaxID=28256 RepID=UPI0012EF8D00|nr:MULTISPECIES: glycerate kinase [Halomonas]CAD5255836.1 Glycerate kinase [Halomonas sp. 59]CAD5256445.1 Glycerate kinase [Halomonas sp. 113]CAD5262764.1 Glycerate kinase [Halomonas sp. I3]CAD5292878.1 Glycerate kinase [Halomonas sp. 156]VXB18956.1 Glycerate kinase [Halomonas titanicae]